MESVAALEMLEKLFGNVAKNPSEKKYRRVKFETNAKIKAAFESGKIDLRDRVEMFFNTRVGGRRRREQRESGKTT